MRVSRELLKPHTHAGQALQPGDPVELWPHQADQLDAIGITKPPDPAAEAAANEEAPARRRKPESKE